jgi:hypothetical protein
LRIETLNLITWQNLGRGHSNKNFMGTQGSNLKWKVSNLEEIFIVGLGLI